VPEGAKAGDTIPWKLNVTETREDTPEPCEIGDTYVTDMDHLANAASLTQAQERLHELGVPHISANDEPRHDEPEEDPQSNAISLWQVKPADKPEVKLYFNMAPEKQTQEAWETWGYVDTDRKQWSRETGQVGVKWEVSGGWLQIKHDVIIPEDKIAIIFYIPEKNQSEWKQYISTYKEGRLMNLISKYPRSPCKSYIMIGRNYQVGDGEIIDLIHDVSQTF